MANPIPVNTRHARHQPQPAPSARPEPPMRPVPPPEPDRGGDGIGAGVRLIFGFFGLLTMLAFVFGGFILLENVLSPFLNPSTPPVVIQPPQPGHPVNPPRQQQFAAQPTAAPQRNTSANNARSAADSSVQCSPPSRFSVGMTAVVDTRSTGGASTRIVAWTQPGGGIHNSDAEPGMRLSIIGGPQCVYNTPYGQHIRYWQVEFTNRNGRFVSGWVAESIWEGNSVNYLLCTPSQPDC